VAYPPGFDQPCSIPAAASDTSLEAPAKEEPGIPHSRIFGAPARRGRTPTGLPSPAIRSSLAILQTAEAMEAETIVSASARGVKARMDRRALMESLAG
jgi:hypothetical protein